MTTVITRQLVAAAAARIGGRVRQTPVWQLPLKALLCGSPAEASAVDATVTLKLEHHQLGGSFKARGMFNRLLSNPIPTAGVIVASGGNAGIATAAAARALGVPCEVFVPTVSSTAKQAALRALGAKVQVVGAVYADAAAACLERQRESGALLTHAYDQAEVVTGAGTLARELDAQLATLPEPRAVDRVLVSVGGGGLIAGLAAWYQGTPTGIVALEPSLAPTLNAAMAEGEPVDVSVSGVAADSLGARRIGSIAWDVLKASRVQSVLLDDESIVEARQWLWANAHLAVEAAAALPLAALRSGVYRPAAGEHLALIICGANTDPATLTTPATVH